MILIDQLGCCIRIDDNGVPKLIAGKRDHLVDDCLNLFYGCQGDMDKLTGTMILLGFRLCTPEELAALNHNFEPAH